MQRWIVGGAVVPGSPEDAYPGAGKDTNGVGMVAASVTSAFIGVLCPGGGMPGVVGEAGDGGAQAMVAGRAEGDAATFAGGVGDRADPSLDGQLVTGRETLADIAQ